MPIVIWVIWGKIARTRRTWQVFWHFSTLKNDPLTAQTPSRAIRSPHRVNSQTWRLHRSRFTDFRVTSMEHLNSAKKLMMGFLGDFFRRRNRMVSSDEFWFSRHSKSSTRLDAQEPTCHGCPGGTEDQSYQRFELSRSGTNSISVYLICIQHHSSSKGLLTVGCCFGTVCSTHPCHTRLSQGFSLGDREASILWQIDKEYE